MGSLEVGKDADIVLTDGCIFELQTHIVSVYIDGKAI